MPHDSTVEKELVIAAIGEPRHISSPNGARFTYGIERNRFTIFFGDNKAEPHLFDEHTDRFINGWPAIWQFVMQKREKSCTPTETNATPTKSAT